MPFKKGNKFQTPGCEHYCAADDLRTPVIELRRIARVGGDNSRPDLKRCRMFRLLRRPFPDTRQLLGQGLGFHAVRHSIFSCSFKSLKRGANNSRSHLPDKFMIIYHETRLASSRAIAKSSARSGGSVWSSSTPRRSSH